MECSLCQYFSSRRSGDWFVTTSCGHQFHHSCVQQMLDLGFNKYRCPVCRNALSRKDLTQLCSGSLSERDFVSPKRPDYQFKLILIGSGNVGKTCLVQRFTKGVFPVCTKSTIGCDICTKTFEMTQGVANLIIWDTAGQDKFSSMTKCFMRNADGVLLVYDITRPQTFRELPQWLTLVNKAGLQDSVKILVGNKVDTPFERRVTERQGLQLAEEWNMPFFETSARDSVNVEAAFRCVVGELIEHIIRFGDIHSVKVDTIRLHSYLPLGKESRRKCRC